MASTQLTTAISALPARHTRAETRTEAPRPARPASAWMVRPCLPTGHSAAMGPICDPRPPVDHPTTLCRTMGLFTGVSIHANACLNYVCFRG